MSLDATTCPLVLHTPPVPPASAETTWTVVILAGDRRGGDCLATELGIAHKGLVRIGTEPMLLRVVSAVRSLSQVRRILLVTSSHDAFLQDQDLRGSLELSNIEIIDAQSTIADSILYIADQVPDCWPMLVTTADHALLTHDIVEAFLSATSDEDIVVGMVEKQTMLKAYPNTKRTWLHFRGGSYTGANLFQLKNTNVLGVLHFWKSLEQDRKKSWRLLSHCGPLIFLLVALRILTLERALEKLGQRFNVLARPVLLKSAEAGIDVDTLQDLTLVEEILSRRGDRC